MTRSTARKSILTMILVYLFDIILIGMLIGLSLRIVSSSDAMQSIILFITFGLIMALSWARLSAPDIALAEAALGAGITGALLLGSLRYLTGTLDKAEPAQNNDQELFPKAHRVTGNDRSHAESNVSAESATTAMRGANDDRSPSWLSGIVIAGLAVCLLAAVWWVPRHPDSVVGALALDNVPNSGVENPITAVLLNFRSYDTLLEVAVLLVAVLGVWGLGALPQHAPEYRTRPNAMLRALVQFLVPIILVVGGYLLWAGSKAPGGAFQAGAVWGAGGVLLIISGMGRYTLRGRWIVRAVLALGLVAFLLLAVYTTWASGTTLQLPPQGQYWLILGLETCIAISIAATLVVMFAGRTADA